MHSRYLTLMVGGILAGLVLLLGAAHVAPAHAAKQQAATSKPATAPETPLSLACRRPPSRARPTPTATPCRRSGRGTMTAGNFEFPALRVMVRRLV